MHKCIDGFYGPCVDDVLPLQERCNDIDDNCDGLIDEGLFCVKLAAGSGTQGARDGALDLAQFNGPNGLALDKKGNLFISDQNNHCIRMLDTKGAVTTVAGTCGNSGFLDGPAKSALFNKPQGLAFDASGNLYISDVDNGSVRVLDETGKVSTLAGTGKPGHKDGPGATAQFNGAFGLAMSPSGDLFVADAVNHVIRKIDLTTKVVSTFAGTPGMLGNKDGPVATALFHTPSRLSFNQAGDLIIGDSLNHTVRRIDTKGNVTTIAGTGKPGYADSSDPLKARFRLPTGIVNSAKGDIYIADMDNGMIRRLVKGGGVQTIAGTGLIGAFQPGKGPFTHIGKTISITYDGKQTIYIASTGTNQIYTLTIW